VRCEQLTTWVKETTGLFCKMTTSVTFFGPEGVEIKKYIVITNSLFNVLSSHVLFPISSYIL
jgi:hypothetical protein